MNLISIVISIYNEENNLEKLFDELLKVEENIREDVSIEYICVNDGSTDNSLTKLLLLKENIPNIKIFNLFRNFGHEIAMTAGMEQAKGDAVIFMDADLQHPPHLIEQMIKLWLNGNKLVFTKKNNRSDKGLLYKILSNIYYFILNKLSDIPIQKDYPDFRLLDRKYVNLLLQIDENNRMFRSLLNYIGINNYAIIEFEVPKRYMGKSKYNLKKSFSLAVNGIMQFSIKPLRFAIYLGLTAIIFSIFLAMWTFFQYLFFNYERTGYATILIVMIFIGSVQLLVLGIIGEYIGKIHLEVKKRPLYFGEFIDE
jgi:dolichol-phosphate mannosyltransferase